jgi:hypothetical protein
MTTTTKASVLIGVEEAATLLGVEPRRIYTMVAHGSFPDGVVVRVGRAIVFLRPRLLAWAGLAQDRDG